MYQQITIAGNLGRDVEMRYTNSGTPVASFSVATSRRWTDSDGNKQERTVWFRVTAWRQLAEICAKYLEKGSQVLVVGEMEEPNVYQAQNGEHRASLDVTAREVKFIGSRQDTPSSNGNGQVAASAPVNDEGIPF